MGHQEDIKRLVPICKEMYRKDADIEKILSYLRQEVGTRTKSMVILTHVLGISLTKAKEIVSASKTWADMRLADQRFTETLQQVEDILREETLDGDKEG